MTLQQKVAQLPEAEIKKVIAECGGPLIKSATMSAHRAIAMGLAKSNPSKVKKVLGIKDKPNTPAKKEKPPAEENPPAEEK